MVNLGTVGFVEESSSVGSFQQQQQPGGNSNSTNNSGVDIGCQQLEGGKLDETRLQNPQQQISITAPRSPFSMPGVLHYIQHEWSRFEMERAQWEMERAELQARMSFLQGERKGQENLKQDLVRRIKMLEYSLRQERAKNYRLTHNGQEPDNETQRQEEMDVQIPLDVDAVATQPHSNLSWRQGRQLLRQYLQEIGYSETILDVRSFRVKNLLGLLPTSDWPQNDQQDGDPRAVAARALKDSENSVFETMAFLETDRKINDDDSDDDITQMKESRKGEKRKMTESLDVDTREALGEFDFLNRNEERKIVHGKDENNWGVDQQAISRMKEKYRSEQERKRLTTLSDVQNAQNLGQTRTTGESLETGKKPVELDQFGNNDSVLNINQYLASTGSDIDAALGLIDDEANINIADEFALDEPGEGALPKKWTLRWTLRSHWDCVRCMQFHPVEPVLVTISEDGTAKLWNLSTAVVGRTTTSDTQKGHEFEPVYTFRGHRGPVVTMDMSPTGDMCFTGGVDGTVRCWSLPSINTEIYDKFDTKVLTETLKGHTDIVWDVAFHTSDNRLVSASADGTLKLWEPGNGEPLLKTFCPPSPECTPTSVDFVSTEPSQLLAAYNPGSARIFDLESGRTVLTFDDSKDDGENMGRISQILSHPTMPVTVTAGEDRKIRYFDNNTGQLIQSTVAHVESISSLAVDPNGLYLLSGSHDGSLRLWNMEKRICLQEIAAHRRKFDMSVLAVAFHPSRPLIGSAGADGLAKVYG